MPYPSKTDRETILSAAIEQIGSGGIRAMSLRSLAASLGLAPNALYRYFADRASLEAAVSAEVAARLHALLRNAAGKKAPPGAIRALAATYLKFARENRFLYEILMLPCRGTPEETSKHEQLWYFVVEEVGRLAGPARAQEAAVALWAFLHGVTALDAAEVFAHGKPIRGLAFGLEAWLARASRFSSARPKRS
jgi:AcrR family transcriptional regulator